MDAGAPRPGGSRALHPAEPSVHADRAEVDFVASADAAALVTRRAPGERYAFVEIDVELDLELEPVPERAALRELLDLAERDCFVGASLTPAPRYHWRVNGTSI